MRIDRDADVLDRDIVENIDVAGARIDRDMAGVRAVAVGADRGGEGALRFEAGEIGEASRACRRPSPRHRQSRFPRSESRIARVAAARIAASRLLQPSITAEPPTTIERDAKVPKPSRT